jgi:hypothetical protein
VDLSSTPNGGLVQVFNKTGEGIATMKADEYGKGRTLKPGQDKGEYQ